MEFKKSDDMYFVRLEKGEDVVASLKQLAQNENIETAAISGIGAASEVTLGVFFPATKEYQEKVKTGIFEITSLMGTLTRKDGEPYLHLHINIADETNQAFGGHLVGAKISATGEIIVKKINTKVGRKFSDEIGLNLFDFS